MQNYRVIDVGREFSTTPGGKTKALSEWSAEEFRDDHVMPALNSARTVVIKFDSIVGVTNSFLEELFGGIVRIYGASFLRRVQVEDRVHPYREKSILAFYQQALEQPSAHLDFAGAFQRLLEGSSIARKGWAASVQLCLVKLPNHRLAPKILHIEGASGISWEPSQEDLLASDWYISGAKETPCP